jgi:hypothetical protein
MRRETHDIYYSANDREEFNRQYMQWRLDNPYAYEVEQTHVLFNPEEGIMRGTITFEVDERL